MQLRCYLAVKTLSKDYCKSTVCSALPCHVLVLACTFEENPVFVYNSSTATYFSNGNYCAVKSDAACDRSELGTGKFVVVNVVKQFWSALDLLVFAVCGSSPPPDGFSHWDCLA